MFDQTVIDPIKSAIDSANSIVIVLPPEPDTDLIASGLALYLSFSPNKSVQIGCSSPVKSSGRLTGIEKIQNSIGSQNLVISLDYSEEKLDKIDYEKTPDGNVKLFVKPLPGQPAPDPSSVKIGYAGATADLVFILGIQTLEELGKLYSDEKNFFDTANIISLNITNSLSSFAKFTLHTTATSSLSEIVSCLFHKGSFNVSPEIASNLLLPIVEATNNFASLKTSADTFEQVAFLLKSGGKRPPTITPFSGVTSPKPTPPPSKVPSDWQSPKVFSTKPINTLPKHTHSG